MREWQKGAAQRWLDELSQLWVHRRGGQAEVVVTWVLKTGEGTRVCGAAPLHNGCHCCLSRVESYAFFWNVNKEVCKSLSLYTACCIVSDSFFSISAFIIVVAVYRTLSSPEIPGGSLTEDLLSPAETLSLRVPLLHSLVYSIESNVFGCVIQHYTFITTIFKTFSSFH